ncbi:hypothetical protein N7520_006411 [Penicillium odoratum]|uniref:uncharacterized protein n=1 Tax=Penicillium odoratum TaxID=1167516 RepID=UPI0025494FBC|nr:uncharacterized protein N7520_006411 [Penicillium odoratum]KAJ5759255.1 hypothetical protein N7520_006411 [Penicillium odoratum]
MSLSYVNPDLAGHDSGLGRVSDSVRSFILARYQQEKRDSEDEEENFNERCDCTNLASFRLLDDSDFEDIPAAKPTWN